MSTTTKPSETARKGFADFFIEQFERPLDIDENDPLDVALVSGFRLLGRAFEERQTRGRGEQAVQRVLEEERAPELSRRYPAYDPGALLILAWAARVAKTPEDEPPQPGCVIWANQVLRRMLDGRAAPQGRDSDLHVNQSLWDFFRQAAAGKGHPDDSQARHSKDAMQRFHEALHKAPKAVLGMTREELGKEAGQLKLFKQDLTDTSEVSLGDLQIEVFRYYFELDDQPRLILGARLLEPGGVHLRFGGDETLAAGRYFDLYAVWKIALPRNMLPEEEVSSRCFVSIQGIFIPVDLRHKLEQSRRKLQDQWRTAALVARNMSHNMGSHAMLHLSADLANGVEIMPSDLSHFLQYLVHRSDIVAMLASSKGHPFSVGLRISRVVARFDRQTLLHKYLCKTEGLRLGPIQMTGPGVNMEVDCPGGLVGAQALCAILENFARNSAKHSQRRSGADGRIQLHLEVSPDQVSGQRLLKCCLSDSCAAPIGEEELRRIQGATNSCIGIEATRTRPAHEIGLGTEETITWIRYLRHIYGSVEGLTPALLEYTRAEDNSLELVFYLVRMRNVSVLDGVEKEATAEMSQIPTQLTLLRCSSGEELQRSGPLPGRWLKAAPRGPQGRIKLRSRFGDLDWSQAGEFLHGKTRPSTIYSAYLETLREATLGSANRQLHLVVINEEAYTAFLDGPAPIPVGELAIEVPLELEGMSFHVVSESEPSVEAVLHDLGLPGAVAIWRRHAQELPSAEPGTRAAKQLVHFELYESTRAVDYYHLFGVETLRNPNDVALLALRLAECALLRGYIVDERFRIRSSYERERLRWAGVQLVNPLAEGQGDLSGLMLSLETHGQPWLGAATPVSFVSVHASLARQSRLIASQEWVPLLGQIQAQIPCVALHSGRGGVEEIRDMGLPFLPASLLDNRLFDDLVKVYFTEALMRGGWIDAKR